MRAALSVPLGFALEAITAGACSTNEGGSPGFSSDAGRMATDGGTSGAGSTTSAPPQPGAK